MTDTISFLSPIDGDMLNEYDGTVSLNGLMINVKIRASSGKKIKVNGIESKYENDVFMAEVKLKEYENVIEAEDVETGEKQQIVVFWLKNFVNRYRLSIDDNIWFLKDLSLNAGKYKSLFDNTYMNFLKEVHTTYGTKIHLNLFYKTDGFDLSQMTDKFKSEWKENADWLRLSFHSVGDKPDRPYLNSGYNELKRDCEMVHEQIIRFAGEELMGPVMSLHWGDIPVEGCRALRDAGYTGLAGYFNAEVPDPFAYYLDEEKRRHVNKHFIWRDNKEGITFARMALVINLLKLEQIVPYMDGLRVNSHKPAYIDYMIHEQYFYPYYQDYQSDYRQKILTSVKWASDNDYQPAFLSECICK
jgi:hypothetical protein